MSYSILKHSKHTHKLASRVSSRTSSSLSSAKAKATAKRTSLEIEAASFEKRAALQQEELRIKQQRDALDLEIKLAKANAEKRAYSTVEGGNLITPHAPTRNDARSSTSNTRPHTLAFERKHDREVMRSTLDPNAQEWLQTSPVCGQSTINHRNAEQSVSGDPSASFMAAQEQQREQIERLLKQQERHTAALLLPQPEVPMFKGEPTEYCAFIRAFENLIEAKTDSSSARLFYLVQYTVGDVKELMSSCLAMKPEDGYREARRLLKERYGQNYKIAAAYVDRLTKGPPIKA